MILEALALGSLLILVNGGHSPRAAARIVGRFAGSSAASLRRIRAEAESQIAKQSERAESAMSKGEGVENQRKRMERLRAVQAEASSLIQLLSTPPSSLSRPSFAPSPAATPGDSFSSASVDSSPRMASSTPTAITTATFSRSTFNVSQPVDQHERTTPTTSRISTASRISSLLELERQFLK